MDHVKIEKLQAINNYKKNQFLDNLIFFSSTLVLFVLFCSSPIWFPYIYSSIKFFLFVYLPNIKQIIFNPKCLFVVCNVIVVVLIGESKFVGSKSASPATEIYDEYVKRSVSLRRVPTIVETPKEEYKPIHEIEVSEEKGEEKGEEVEEVIGGEEEEKLVEEFVDEVEEEVCLPTEELNQKVEDFIAKINKQRRLEAELLVCTNE